MFGTNGNTPYASNRPSASDVARIEGTYAQFVISGSSSVDTAVFLNGRPLDVGAFESATIEIIAPGPDNRGTVSAILSSYQTGADGGSVGRTTSLFPGTVEVVANGRRFIVTCMQPGSFEGLWLGLGLRGDGTSSELTGVQSLRVAISPGLLDAKLVWSEDGATEDILNEV